MRLAAPFVAFAFLLVGCKSPADPVETAETQEETDSDTAPGDTADTEETGGETGEDDPCEVPPPECLGICAFEDAVCTEDGWECVAEGKEDPEISCDGYDNDCDGQVDEEGVCPDCTIDIDRLTPHLYSIADIDFDFACNAYLTSFVSGPDWTVYVPSDTTQSATKYFGNKNQNMGWALVDPNPENQRVVVTYSCCSSCGCQAANGLTLLYTCSADEPDCGCADETNCPGFLDEPFLSAGYEDVSATLNGFSLTTPLGLAAGPNNSYFVGNYRPKTCSTESDCTACDPDHPGVFCEVGAANCCDTAASGRLVQFTLPDATTPARWRVTAIFEGEVIQGLASGRSGVTWVGTDQGNVYAIDPSGVPTLLQTLEGAVYSVTQNRLNGDWYLETRSATTKILRFSESGAPLALPADVPAAPDAEGVLQAGPDGKLYRVIPRLDKTSTLEAWEL